MKGRRMTFDETIYWLLEEIEERRKNGKLQTNFSLVWEAPKPYKSSIKLYPSLLDDPNFDEYKSKRRKTWMDIKIL